MLKFLEKYKFSLFVALVIFYLSVRQTVPDVFYLEENNKVLYRTEDRSIDIVYFRDFFGHMAFYSLLALTLFYESWKVNVDVRSRKMVLVAVVLPILYGGLVELIQENFFPPRSAEWMDWFSDILGVLLAYLFALKMCPKWMNFKYKQEKL